MRGDVQSGLVGADRVHTVYYDSTREFVTEFEWRHRSATLELVDTVGDAVHRASELLAEPPGVAIVMPVGQQDVLGLDELSGVLRGLEAEPG